MKIKLYAVLALLTANASLFSANLEWNSPTNGNLDDAGNWNPSQLPIEEDRLYFSESGSYTLGSSSAVSVTSVETRGSSGTVSFDMGLNGISAASTFIIRQNTEFLSGIYSATNLQTGVGVASKSVLLSGANTVFTTNAVDVGRSIAANAGSATQLTVSGGAKLNSGTFIIGRNESAAATNNNAVTVTGVGSEVNAGGIIIGNLNNGTTGAAARNNVLAVNDGGSLTATSLIISRRASGVTLLTANGNRMIVGGTGADSTVTISGAVSVGAAGNDNYIEVRNGGTMNVAGNTSLNSRAGTALRVHGGTYDAAANTILVYNNATLSVQSSGIVSAGTVDMRGAFEGVGEGQVTATELLSLNTSVYSFTLNGVNDHTQFVVSGNAAFDGTLNIALGTGFNVSSGDVFQIFDFGSSTGSFANVVLADLSGGLEWDISELYSDGIIQVIPEPAFYTSLFALFGIAFWVYRRRTK